MVVMATDVRSAPAASASAVSAVSPPFPDSAALLEVFLKPLLAA